MQLIEDSSKSLCKNRSGYDKGGPDYAVKGEQEEYKRGMNDEDAKLLQVEVRIFYTVTTMEGLIIRSPTIRRKTAKEEINLLARSVCCAYNPGSVTDNCRSRITLSQRGRRYGCQVLLVVKLNFHN